MSEWKADTRHQKQVGEFTMVPERRAGETAHRVSSEDGRGIRVLPCDHASGQKRSRVILGALMALEDVHWRECRHEDVDHDEMDPYLYLTGVLGSHAIPWESTGSLEDVSIELWLAEWLEAGGSASQLLAELTGEGWKIVRAE